MYLVMAYNFIGWTVMGKKIEDKWVTGSCPLLHCTSVMMSAFFRDSEQVDLDQVVILNLRKKATKCLQPHSAGAVGDVCIYI